MLCSELRRLSATPAAAAEEPQSRPVAVAGQLQTEARRLNVDSEPADAVHEPLGLTEVPAPTAANVVASATG